MKDSVEALWTRIEKSVTVSAQIRTLINNTMYQASLFLLFLKVLCVQAMVDFKAIMIILYMLLRYV